VAFPRSQFAPSTFATKALPASSRDRGGGTAASTASSPRPASRVVAPSTWWVRRIGNDHRHQLEGTFLTAKARGHGDDRPGPDRRRTRPRSSRSRASEGLEGTARRQRLQRVEGRCRAAHQEHGDRLRRSRRARQLCVPGLHRHADVRGVFVGDGMEGVRAEIEQSTSCAASGRPRRSRVPRCSLVVARRLVRDGRRAAGRRRVTPPAAIMGSPR